MPRFRFPNSVEGKQRAGEYGSGTYWKDVWKKDDLTDREFEYLINMHDDYTRRLFTIQKAVWAFDNDPDKNYGVKPQ